MKIAVPMKIAPKNPPAQEIHDVRAIMAVDSQGWSDIVAMASMNIVPTR
jgi:hypothetical protein